MLERFGRPIIYKSIQICGTNMPVVIIIMTTLFTAAICAEEKFLIDGDTLTYRTDQSEDSEGIIFDDFAVLKSLLKENNQVRVVELSSGGGEVGAAY